MKAIHLEVTYEDGRPWVVQAESFSDTRSV